MKVITQPGKRNEGLASQALEFLCDAADDNEVKLCLEAEPYGDDRVLDTDELAEWYEGFGFQGQPDEMIREPQCCG